MLFTIVNLSLEDITGCLHDTGLVTCAYLYVQSYKFTVAVVRSGVIVGHVQ